MRLVADSVADIDFPFKKVLDQLGSCRKHNSIKISMSYTNQMGYQRSWLTLDQLRQQFADPVCQKGYSIVQNARAR
jgi:hypothetical protein